MPLRPTTLRFSELAFELIREEAQQQGVPVAQYIREAGLIRAMGDRVRRGATSQPVQTYSELAMEVRRLAAPSQSDPHEGGPPEGK